MIPDPIERGEASAERAFDELSRPGGLFKCYQCEAVLDLNKEGGTISPDPYAMPVCGKCCEAAFSADEIRHVCTSCCNPLDTTPENPARTDWCACCGHRSEGQKRAIIKGKYGSTIPAIR